jgi:hypothetical protein
MSTKAKRELADSLSKTFVLGVKRKASKSINTTEIDHVNAYSLGYLESFLAGLMASNPKVMAEVVERMKAHATEE